MGTQDSKDLLKNMDWKTLSDVPDVPGMPVIKKRLPGKIRQIPDYYFLPRRSLPSAIAVYGTICAAGIGAGMLVEFWINKKVKGLLHVITSLTKFGHRPIISLSYCLCWSKYIIAFIFLVVYSWSKVLSSHLALQRMGMPLFGRFDEMILLLDLFGSNQMQITYQNHELTCSYNYVLRHLQRTLFCHVPACFVSSMEYASISKLYDSHHSTLNRTV